ncbi:MAG TPA: histidine-type phosphatase [Bryobacteraceae bacterium]|nr:histidine-type phosphatase [Bryobacteraceae bacterium]
MTQLRSKLTGFLLAFAVLPPVVAQTIQNNDKTVLKQIIVFGRHGVRAPTSTPAQYAQFSPRPYPNFGVSTGYLTIHGQQAEVLLGTYFRTYLLTEGLLTGNAEADLGATYFRANSIQRSNVTATMFGQGLFPGATIPVHSYTLGVPDPVFDPILAKVATVDPARAALDVQQVYAGGSALAAAYSAEFSLVRSVLFNYPNGTEPPPPAPSGVTDAASEPVTLTATAGPLYTGGIVNLGGLQDTAETAADPFVMEYAAGLPAADVAWGALSSDALSQQLRLVTLTLNIEMEDPYLDQVQSSNAAAHVLRSMKQVVSGAAVPGAFSAPGTKVLVVISSDAYVAGLAGLLNAHWQLPGYQADFCAPGGALIFELRQSPDTGAYLVRVYYTTQSLDQLRNLTPLSLTAPPETTQLYIPGGSSPGGSFDVDFDTFQKLVTQAISLQYVQDPSAETPPAVLTKVPLE